MTSSDKLSELLIASLKRVVGVNGDMHDFLQECVAELAGHHACMRNDECGDIDACDLWDEKTDPFEAGVKLGATLGRRRALFSAFISDDEIGDPDIHLGAQWVFWFVAEDERSAVASLKKKADDWVKKVQKENGLLPFEA